MSSIKIVNGTLITPDRVLPNGAILLSDGLIVAIEETPVESPATNASATNTPATNATTIIDAKGCFVAPGFIDLHVHGGGGHDFMDGTEEAFLAIAQLHARHGTTAMTPTTLSAGKQQLLATLETYERLAGKPTGGARFIGMHLEGPYFAMSQRGAQDPRHIRNPDPAEYEELIARFPGIRRWSVAPELPGALEMAGRLKQKGILAAWAHTEALYDDIVKAFEHGYTHATHLYSAMLGVTRRNAARFAGAVEAAFLIEEMTVEIIADGIHLPPPLLQLVCKEKGPTKTALITDAMRGAGMPPGESILGAKDAGLKVIIEDGVAKLPDRSAFAGSVATADRLVRTMLDSGQSLPDTIRMITKTPAGIMGIADHKGSIAKGFDADLTIFDADINIQYTIAGGNIIYQKEKKYASRSSANQ
ncbi:MAG TPA: N-acetylglucosamine-6-phosphate deacetylase [Puia sp.]|uniref:N-acetylglucosamine-6-phosphate deacetylase n=1 Tax=Puia sp. TaxID=2045100 RepID=UPI002CB22D03|nr:N-acetylglucosamine-6-phosphate deacetylase [Puia sp.]HVU99342.1 N-acetylglucosamine-6-phosphate deacetylase [Puia sp.]